jgi:hypothetical protein
VELRWEQDQNAESLYYLMTKCKEYRIVFIDGKHIVVGAPLGAKEFVACLFPTWHTDLDKVKENVINLLSMRKSA